MNKNGGNKALIQVEMEMDTRQQVETAGLGKLVGYKISLSKTSDMQIAPPLWQKAKKN